MVVYRYRLVHNQMIWLARTLKDQAPASEEEPQFNVHALGAIVMAAAAVEAAVNHKAEGLLNPERLKALPIFRLARRAVDRERQPTKKLKLLAQGMDVEFRENDPPWPDARTLRRFRHELVHWKARPVFASTGEEFFPEVLRPLAGHLDLWDHFEAGATWLDALVNHKAAAWAVDVAEQVLDTLKKPPWEKKLGSE